MISSEWNIKLSYRGNKITPTHYTIGLLYGLKITKQKEKGNINNINNLLIRQ